MKTYTKIIAWISLALLCISLLPLFALSLHNHPTGDDYDYGVETGHAWKNTHNPFVVIQEAAKGVATQYKTWQGTYSAMFLMYLPPNIFGESAYHLVTFLLLFLLLAGTFFLTHQVLCGLLGASKEVWISVASLLSLLCIQTTPFAAESYYWYNGSMYYTGYLAISHFYLGLLCRLLKKPGLVSCALASLLAFFLAGGNYVSLLPVMLLSFTITGIVLFRFLKKKASGAALSHFLTPCFFLCVGFLISAMAPGNKVRQSGMWKISAVKAILKSLRQGSIFLLGWTSLLVVIALVLLTPILWEHYKQLRFSFRLPLLAIGFGYGILCSTTCPTFYTMNSTGPARAAAVMYYNFMFFMFFAYYYFLGWLHSVLAHRRTSLGDRFEDFLLMRKRPIWYALPAALIVLAVLLGQFTNCNAVRAYRCIRNGDAAAYEKQHLERLRILADSSVEDVVFAPYERTADLLYVGDMTDDPNHPTNQRIAAYFDKHSIIVSSDATE